MRDGWDDRSPWWTPAIIFAVLFGLSLWFLLAVTP
jgi:hypothetical protein